MPTTIHEIGSSMFAARINMPGYTPETEPAPFEAIGEAWQYLAEERERGEDAASDGPHLPECQWNREKEYSDTLTDLRRLADDENWVGQPESDRLGVISGDTPGGCGCPDDSSQSKWDIGFVYVVSIGDEKASDEE